MEACRGALVSAVAELPSNESWCYAIRYAWNVVRGLPPPEFVIEKAPQAHGSPSTPRHTAATRWTAEMDAIVIRDYPAYRDAGEIPVLAKRLMVTPTALGSRAGKLKVTKARIRR